MTQLCLTYTQRSFMLAWLTMVEMNSDNPFRKGTMYPVLASSFSDLDQL